MAQSVLKTVIARYKTILEAENKWIKPSFKKLQYDLVWNRDYSLTGGYFLVNTLSGRIKLAYHPEGMDKYFDPTIYKFGTAKLVNKHGKYYLHIPVTYDVEEFDVSKVTNVVGIDRGINFVVATYDSKQKSSFVNGRTIKQKRANYSKLRRELQMRRTPSSRRRIKAIGQRENRWMQDVNHCISKALVDNNPKHTLFVLEDLSGVRNATERVRTKDRYVSVSWSFYDLEQRAGRIVRQGNENSDVNIFRYVTENTFDAYLWQTIENKQKFISQIMTSKTPARVAEDVDESSLNYAEIKALATGNPLIKEKMDLDNEVVKLKMLESNYKSNRYRLEDKVVKSYPEEIKRLETLIEAVREDIRTAEPLGKGEDKFTSISLNGEEIRDKKLAGEKLLETVKKVGIFEKKTIGKYRNFDLEVKYDSFRNQYNFNLCGKTKHSGELGSSPDGNLIRLDNVIEKMTDKLARYEQNLETTKEQLENAKNELTKPFEKADELKSKVLRLAELNRLLDMGDVEEKVNESPLLEDLKRAIVDFCEYEYEDERYTYEAFDTLFPDLSHVGIAYTTTPDGEYEIQFELNLTDYTATQYVNGTAVSHYDYLKENGSVEKALDVMKFEMENGDFATFVAVDEEELKVAMGLDIDDDGNFYDPLSKDLDNDGIPDRYDHDFRDSDYEESSFDIDGLKKHEKPSILEQIKSYQNDEKTLDKQDNKEKEKER